LLEEDKSFNDHEFYEKNCGQRRGFHSERQFGSGREESVGRNIALRCCPYARMDGWPGLPGPSMQAGQAKE